MARSSMLNTQDRGKKTDEARRTMREPAGGFIYPSIAAFNMWKSRPRDSRVVPNFAMSIHSHLGTYYERQGPVMPPDSHNPGVSGRRQGVSRTVVRQ